MAKPTPLIFTIGVCLAVQTSGIHHKTVVLSENQTNTQIIWVDGATVMSYKNYVDEEYQTNLIIKPSRFDVECHLMVNFVDIDLPKRKPCEDFIEMCEITWDAEFGCERPMVPKFCGTLDDLFPPDRYGKGPHQKWTQDANTSIRISFSTRKPTGYHRGFEFIVTSFSKSGLCGRHGHFQCDDGYCVSTDLHCDGVAHCFDGTDETNNCSHSDVYVPITYCGPNDRNPLCRGQQWGERWFGLAIPMAIVMVLLFFAIAVKVRKQLCNPMSLGNGSRDRLHPSHRRERAVQAPPIPQRPVIGPGWICPHERSNNTLPPPEIDVGFTDAATLMLLPPPYSPPEDRPANPYDPPTEGDPPPLYEDSLHHTLQSEKATIVAPPADLTTNNSSHYTPGTSSLHRPNPPAYQVLPPAPSISNCGLTSCSPPPHSSSSSSPSALVVSSSGGISLVSPNNRERGNPTNLIPFPSRPMPSPVPHSSNAELSL